MRINTAKPFTDEIDRALLTVGRIASNLAVQKMGATENTEDTEKEARRM